jgi:hypothetical protein
MSTGIWAAVSGAVGQTAALDVAANNVANVSTPGFRADRELFRQTLANAQGAGADESLRYSVVRSVRPDLSAGQIVSTNRGLDVALRGADGELLTGLDGVSAPTEPSYARSNFQSYCVRLPEAINQLAVMQHMLEAGVSTRRGIVCSHREPAYPKGTWRCEDARCDATAGACPHLQESERAQDHAICLPLFHQLTHPDQDRVVAALRDALQATRSG